MKKYEKKSLKRHNLFREYINRNKKEKSLVINFNNNNSFLIINKTKQIIISFKNKIQSLNIKNFSEMKFLILKNSFGNCKNKIKEMTMIYKYKSNKNKYRLFGDQFYENNKKNCRIIVNGKLKKFSYYIKFNEMNKKNTFKIKLKSFNRIESYHCMFLNCSFLLLLKNIPMITSNINDISEIFSKCRLLKELPDISNWNTSNVHNMSNMFYECKSLKELPDISKWDTNNINDMSFMFYGCSSLKELPDISNWKTSKVINMSNIFLGCSSLKELPDISKWNISNINNMIRVFFDCS